MKSKVWMSIGLMFFGLFAFSQSAAPNDLLNGSGIIKVKDGKADYDGSPFFKKDFEIGNVGAVKERVMLKYNIYRDQILFQRNGETFELPKTDAYNPIMIGNYKIELIDGSYYHVLAEGAMKLLQKDVVSFERGGQSSNGYVLPKPNTYTRESPEFYIYRGGKLEKLDRRLKNVSEILPNFKTGKKKPTLEDIGRYIDSTKNS